MQTLNERLVQLQRWWDKLLQQQTDDPNLSWQPERLEHQFSVSAPEPDDATKRTSFKAEEYYQGHLDWYNLDAVDGRGTGDPASDPSQAELQEKIIDFFPTNLSFGGMPDTRWWTLEERETSFVGISPDTTDLNKLLVMDESGDKQHPLLIDRYVEGKTLIYRCQNFVCERPVETVTELF